VASIGKAHHGAALWLVSRVAAKARGRWSRTLYQRPDENGYQGRSQALWRGWN
jgi:hypothetical protein